VTGVEETKCDCNCKVTDCDRVMILHHIKTRSCGRVITRVSERHWKITAASGVASYGALGHIHPRLPTISFLVYFGVNLTATIQVLCSLRDQLMQMSTTHSSFNQYCISHKTISHEAVATPGPEVRRECPMI